MTASDLVPTTVALTLLVERSGRGVAARQARSATGLARHRGAGRIECGRRSGRSGGCGAWPAGMPWRRHAARPAVGARRSVHGAPAAPPWLL